MSSATADVSVIIATHNRETLVAEAIDSVLAQSMKVREIIVIDDGSTDNTRRTLSHYGSRIRAFFQPNQGPSRARNYGIREARGRWIAFLDDDDVWLREKIERQMQLAQQDPDLGLIYCSDHAVDEQLQVRHTRHAAHDNRGDVFEQLLVRNFIFTSGVIARNDAIEQAGPMDASLKFGEDWDLWLRIAARHPVDFVPEPLVLYRQSATGCLTRDTKAVDRLSAMQVILERALTLRNVSGETARQARYNLEREWTASLLTEGNNYKAFTHSLRAIGSSPSRIEGYRLLAYSLTPSVAREFGRRLLRRGASPQADDHRGDN
ncbi:MAG TPA: glycosyltransferase family A protein [Candidatus Angelobacter sp.]|jgi:glycosyltransferase involved in cell wall biosynthesis|nr:glycosyltransferase family A protein [Candidatus Angelobacter sp.]